MKRNIYLVEIDYKDYDQYDGVVIVAENEEEARQIAERDYVHHSSKPDYNQEITNIELIGIAIDSLPQERNVILASFNAG